MGLVQTPEPQQLPCTLGLSPWGQTPHIKIRPWSLALPYPVPQAGIRHSAQGPGSPWVQKFGIGEHCQHSPTTKFPDPGAALRAKWHTTMGWIWLAGWGLNTPALEDLLLFKRSHWIPTLKYDDLGKRAVTWTQVNTMSKNCYSYSQVQKVETHPKINFLQTWKSSMLTLHLGHRIIRQPFKGNCYFYRSIMKQRELQNPSQTLITVPLTTIMFSSTNALLEFVFCTTEGQGRNKICNKTKSYPRFYTVRVLVQHWGHSQWSLLAGFFAAKGITITRHPQLIRRGIIF